MADLLSAEIRVGTSSLDFRGDVKTRTGKLRASDPCVEGFDAGADVVADEAHALHAFDATL